MQEPHFATHMQCADQIIRGTGRLADEHNACATNLSRVHRSYATELEATKRSCVQSTSSLAGVAKSLSEQRAQAENLKGCHEKLKNELEVSSAVVSILVRLKRGRDGPHRRRAS